MKGETLKKVSQNLAYKHQPHIFSGFFKTPGRILPILSDTKMNYKTFIPAKRQPQGIAPTMQQNRATVKDCPYR